MPPIVIGIFLAAATGLSVAGIQMWRRVRRTRTPRRHDGAR
jgi:hypothetical protein